MADSNLASRTTLVQQKGQNAQKVKVQYCTINECESNKWQTENNYLVAVNLNFQNDCSNKKAGENLTFKLPNKSVCVFVPVTHAGLRLDYTSTISPSSLHPPYCQELIELVSLLLESRALMAFLSSAASDFSDSDVQLCYSNLQRNLCLDKHTSRKSP